MFRRHLHERRNEYRDVLGMPVVCHGRDKALRPGGVEAFVAVAAGRPGCQGVLVVLDAEEDPACTRGPELLARALAVTGKPVYVCLAERTYEDWLYASAETLQLDDLAFTPGTNAESRIREALDSKYIKPTWAPRLTSRMDLELALSRSMSLRRTLGCLDVLTDLVALELEEDHEPPVDTAEA